MFVTMYLLPKLYQYQYHIGRESCPQVKALCQAADSESGTRDTHLFRSDRRRRRGAAVVSDGERRTLMQYSCRAGDSLHEKIYGS